MSLMVSVTKAVALVVSYRQVAEVWASRWVDRKYLPSCEVGDCP